MHMLYQEWMYCKGYKIHKQSQSHQEVIQIQEEIKQDIKGIYHVIKKRQIKDVLDTTRKDKEQVMDNVHININIDHAKEMQFKQIFLIYQHIHRIRK